MLVCGAFEDCRALTFAAEWLLSRFETPKKLSLVMVLFIVIERVSDGVHSCAIDTDKEKT
jgi:hypothetical protein